jgi:hypothetical protein
MRSVMKHLVVLMVCFLGVVTVAQESKPVVGFSVVLVLGEVQGDMPSQGLSTAAQKALADIREFLPYKGYRVLDSQWVAGSALGESRGRVRGADQRDYEFQLDTFPAQIPGKAVTHSSPLSRARFQLTTLGSSRLLDSTFSITPGETVVVGTSRLQGDSALIVLLTAAVGK